MAVTGDAFNDEGRPGHAGGVHVNVSPEDGIAEGAPVVNRQVCVFTVPAVVPFGASQLGVASGMAVVNKRILKSLLELHLKPT